MTSLKHVQPCFQSGLAHIVSFLLPMSRDRQADASGHGDNTESGWKHVPIVYGCERKKLLIYAPSAPRASEMCLFVSAMSLKLITHLPLLSMTYVCLPGKMKRAAGIPNSFRRILSASVNRSNGSFWASLKALFSAGLSPDTPKTYRHKYSCVSFTYQIISNASTYSSSNWEPVCRCMTAAQVRRTNRSSPRHRRM